MKKNQILFPAVTFLFLLLCSLKSALFNFYVTDSLSVYSLGVKTTVFFNVFFLTSFVYLLILRYKYRWLFLLFYILQILFLIVNLTYYFYFEGYLHFNQYFELWSETLELMKHSAVPFEPRILIVFIDLPLFILLFIYYKKLSEFTKLSLFRYGSYVPSLFLMWNFYRWDWMGKETPMQLMSDQYVSEVSAIKKFGLLTVDLYHIYYLKEYQNLIRQFHYGPQHIKTSEDIDSCAQKNNVMIIQIESMDAFIINKMFHHNRVMPNFYEFSHKYIFYPYMLSYHKAGSTSDCEFSCVNSVEALDMFPSIKIRNYDFPNSLPKRFVKDNYNVAIYHGNRGEYFNRRIAFRKMGFPVFYDIDDMKLKEVVWGAPDGDVFQFAINKIVKTQVPFYTHIITMSSHEPFNFVEPYYKTKKFNGLPDTIARRYFTCFSYVDSVVAQFIKDVQYAKPNTYFFIYGDHTPAIKNNKYYTQAAIKDDDLYFEFVPLIIITPDSAKYYEKKKAACFLDIAPTALEASQAPYEISSFGENLLTPDEVKGKIPYRGVNFTREEIYKKIDRVYVNAYGNRK